MDERLRISYETMGYSSYMTVTCPAETEVIHYQLEMVLANEIKNFLAVSRQIMDGEMVIYYNITSRIPLSQILEKRKLKRNELLRLIDGMIAAIRDASEYRLPADGIVMEPEYIYVNPATCEPAFVFLPVKRMEAPDLKHMVSDLILHDRLELSSDNLVQVLLREINSQPFSLESLEKSLKPYHSVSSEMKNQSRKAVEPEMISRQSVNPVMQSQPMQNSQMQNSPLQNQPSQEGWYAGQGNGALQGMNRQPVERGGVAVSGFEEPEKPEKMTPPVKQKKAFPGKGKKEEKKAKNQKIDTDAGEENGFDPEKAKKKFLLPQAIIMVAAAACISFGLFQDETGAIVINNVLAFVIILAVAEVILYREAYVNSKMPKNSKGKKEKGKKSAAGKKQASRPAAPSKAKPVPPSAGRPVPPSVGRPVPPSAERPVTPPVGGPVPSPAERPVQPFVERQVPPAAAVPVYPSAASQVPPKPISQPMMQNPLHYSSAEDMDAEGETELWDGSENGGMSAYLEYFENGKLTRIPIDAQSGILIGRLNTQVDFAVKSPRVGKVHAKFYCQGSQCFVVDINSKNGTYINGSRTRIESNVPYPLCDKDRIMLADSEFTIRCTEI